MLLVVERKKKSTQRNKHNCFIGRNRLTDGKDDGLHVDEVRGHRVEVGVGVLPNREGRRCYSGL